MESNILINKLRKKYNTEFRRVKMSNYSDEKSILDNGHMRTFRLPSGSSMLGLVNEAINKVVRDVNESR
jgi:hypothetical protein